MKENRIKGIHLIGYSGGGAIAVLTASRREDVLSVRTIAANLDHSAHELYKIALEYDPGYTDVWNSIALIYKENEQYDKAIKCYD